MATKPTIREPRSIEAATAACERFAVLDGQIGAIDARRNADIAAVNADADRAANDLIAERDAIVAKLKPWWDKSGKDLLEGKAKSLELGGAILGTRKGKVTLSVPHDQDVAIAALEEADLSSMLTYKTSLDRAALLKAFDGKPGNANLQPVLQDIGFGTVDGTETFFMKATVQGGVRS